MIIYKSFLSRLLRLLRLFSLIPKRLFVHLARRLADLALLLAGLDTHDGCRLALLGGAEDLLLGFFPGGCISLDFVPA